jgi:hypothetical protein
MTGLRRRLALTPVLQVLNSSPSSAVRARRERRGASASGRLKEPTCSSEEMEMRTPYDLSPPRRVEIRSGSEAKPARLSERAPDRAAQVS